MLLKGGNVFLDYYRSLLIDVLDVLDRQTGPLVNSDEDPSVADQLGYYDTAEHITGLGFVACQTYLTATYGRLKIKKRQALSVGPRHPVGQTIAQIINHA